MCVNVSVCVCTAQWTGHSITVIPCGLLAASQVHSASASLWPSVPCLAELIARRPPVHYVATAAVPVLAGFKALSSLIAWDERLMKMMSINGATLGFDHQIVYTGLCQRQLFPFWGNGQSWHYAAIMSGGFKLPYKASLRVPFFHQIGHSMTCPPVTKLLKKNSSMVNLQLPTCLLACLLLLLLLLRCLARWLPFGQCGITGASLDCHCWITIAIINLLLKFNGQLFSISV